MAQAATPFQKALRLAQLPPDQQPVSDKAELLADIKTQTIEILPKGGAKTLEDMAMVLAIILPLRSVSSKMAQFGKVWHAAPVGNERRSVLVQVTRPVNDLPEAQLDEIDLTTQKPEHVTFKVCKYGMF